MTYFRSLETGELGGDEEGEATISPSIEIPKDSNKTWFSRDCKKLTGLMAVALEYFPAKDKADSAVTGVEAR